MPINAECGTAKNETRKHYYKCLERKRNIGCKKTMVRKELIENFILDSILEILKSPKYISEIVNSIFDLQLDNINSILTSLLKDEQRTETTLNNFMNAVEQGVVNNTTNKQMKVLESKIEELEKQIIIEKSKNAVKLTKEEIEKYYIEALKLEPKLLIYYVIKNKKVFDDKAEITFNDLIKTSPENTQGLFLFARLKQMPRIIQNVNTPKMVIYRLNISFNVVNLFHCEH